MQFRQYFDLCEGWAGHLAATLLTLVEGRKNPEILQNRKTTRYADLFPQTPDDAPWQAQAMPGAADLKNPKQKQLLGPDACPITPLSGYQKHIKAIQQYAQKGPAEFAQVLMFSPLSANVGFAKHWDNYQALMLILRYYFPGEASDITKEKLGMIVDAFNDKYYSLGMTINGFKFETVAYIWQNKAKLMQELNALAGEGDDEKLIARLSQLPGVQPVKAGFIAQLIWGRAGCIDTHNIDIYTKVFPDLSGKLKGMDWKGDEGIKNYVGLLGDLNKKGIGTQELWDVWVDFVETMYKMISAHGRGNYTDMGSALDPNDPKYQALKDIKVPKRGIGKQKKDVDVPLIQGRGLGASATHLQMDPDDALRQFHTMYRGGDRQADFQKGSDAARAVPFHLDKFGRTMGDDSGLGREPTATHYFDPALAGKDVDPERVKHIINTRLNRGGRKAWAARQDAAQGRLF